MKNYRTWGKPPNNVVVVHGGPGGVGGMAAVADELSKNYGVLEPQQTALSVNGQVEELYDTVRKQGNPPVILVGHSWGAWLTFMAAANYPALVKKLILVSSGAFEEKYTRELNNIRMDRLSEAERREIIEGWGKFQSSDPKGKDKIFARFGELMGKADTYDALPRKRYDMPEGLGVSSEAFNKVWPEAEELRASGKLLAMGEKIKCPVVAIHGDYDPSPAEGVEKPLYGVLRNFRFILLEKCGHEPWDEKYARDAFFKVLREEIIL
jgi:pimeloyl-ACP methyl ester carboxylesterase